MATGQNNDDRKEATASSQPPTDETSAFYTGTLTFDLVVEILCRVPVKSLMQLRCVCKSWNSLISDSEFANKHLCRSRTQLNRHHLLLMRRDLSSEEFLLWDTELPSLFNSTSTIIRPTQLRFPLNNPDGLEKLVGYCNGILCIATGKIYNSVMVLNPSIRKFRILPPLEYQPQLNCIIYGFGYDCVTDSYKLIAICYYKWDSVNRARKIQVKLHTLGKDTWKVVEGFPLGLQEGFLLSEFGIFVSGAVNWLVGIPTDSSSSQVILSLDLGNESYQEFLLPDYEEVCGLEMGVLRECLSILSHKDTLVIHVWILKDYGNKDSWTKLFVVSYKELFDHQWTTLAGPLYISEDDQLLLDFGVEQAIYNSRDGTGKMRVVQSIFNNYCARFRNQIYVESLILP